MFRRRGIGRSRQHPVPPLLKRAHHLMASGDYTAAASAFYELARKAEDRFPERAPMLYLEAGRAALLAGDGKKSVPHFRKALALLGAQRRFQRVQAVGRRIVAELNERGMTAEAQEISAVVQNNLAADQAPNTQSMSSKQAVLPTHCPSCGAALKPDEVEWLDQVTAECGYCGSPVRGGN